MGLGEREKEAGRDNNRHRRETYMELGERDGDRRERERWGKITRDMGERDTWG